MKQNRYLAAFKESYNLVGLTTAVAASAAMLNPLPLLVGLVAEAAYLMFYADSRWYAARLAKQFDGEVEQRRAELKKRVQPLLTPAMANRFERLENTRRALDKSPAEPGNEEWFREVLRKLDFLMERWLQFADKDIEFLNSPDSVREELIGDDSSAPQGGRKKAKTNLSAVPLPQPGLTTGSAQQRRVAHYKQSGKLREDTEQWVKTAVLEIQAGYDAELAEIEAQRAAQNDFSTTAVLDRRISVLKRRREFVEKIGRIHLNIVNQLSLVEDTFGLISDGIRARSPEQVLADIDDVVAQTSTMTQLLDDFAPYEQLLAS